MKLNLILILFIAVGCNKPAGTNTVPDLSLVYQDDVDIIDLDLNTVTRRYAGSSRTVKIDVGKDKRGLILDFIVDNEVLKINDSDLRDNCNVHMLPQSSFKIDVVIDKGPSRRFDWTSNNCGDQIDILNQLVSLIKEYTVAQLAAESLPPTDITVE